jgi:hypothetical protein
MQKYLNVNTVEIGKIEIIVLVKPEDTFIPVRKHIFLRDDLAPFTFDMVNNFLTVYTEGVGEITLDQTGTQSNSYIINTINDVEITTNEDAYTKLRVL